MSKLKDCFTTSYRRSPHVHVTANYTCLPQITFIGLLVLFINLLFPRVTWPATLTVDGSQKYQTIDGFGVNANVNSWNNGELRPALDMLVDQLGATLWRVVIDNADWEATNDNSDPNTFNWTYYNSVYTSAKFEELWGTVAYLNQKGIASGVMLNFMGRVPAWMGGDHIDSTKEDEWVEMIASLVFYAHNTRGLQFGLLAPMNEPDWDGIEGPQVNSTQYVRLLRKLAQKLDALGMGDIRLVGPDTASVYGGVDNYLAEMLVDSVVMGKIDHFGFHNYAGDSYRADAAIKSSSYPNRNFWITEVTNSWDLLAHLGQGPSACLIWDAYDSFYNHVGGPDPGNGPALLAYNSSSRTYTPRAGFYTNAVLFKFIPPGAVRIQTVSSGPVIYAFHHAPTGRVTIIGHNSTSGTQTINGTLSGLPSISAFESYRTDGNAYHQRDADLSVTGGQFTFSVPANTFFALTTIAGVAPSIPAAPTNLQVQ